MVKFVTPDLEVDVVRDKLSLIQGLGDVDVEHNGDCTAFTYTVTMATKAGDQTEMTVSTCRRSKTRFLCCVFNYVSNSNVHISNSKVPTYV